MDLESKKQIEIKGEDQAKKKKFWLFLNVCLFLISMSLVFIIFQFVQDKKNLYKEISDIQPNKTEQKQIITPAVKKIQRAIDGVLVEEGKENIFPLAIMIENHPDARPQAGLSKASLVIEAEAEGGTTRFLAVFADDQNIDRIGPVRSARGYYLDWAEEFSAAYIHCGGSPEALARIINENILDINEFYKGSLFWRDQKRYAPHNVYTSTEKLRSYLKEKNITATGSFPTWEYKTEAGENERPASQKIEVDYWLKGFDVDWVYSSSTNDYLRIMNGKEHQDENGDKIYAKNVIIQYIPAEVVDELKRLKMDVIGSGKAFTCFDGKCIDAKWNKKSSSMRTRFYDLNGEEIKFNPGTTWIEVVRPGVNVKTE